MINRKAFEQLAVTNGLGIQRHANGLQQGYYIDLRTSIAWRMLCDYLNYPGVMQQLIKDYGQLGTKEPRR